MTFFFFNFLQNKQDTDGTWEYSRPNFDEIKVWFWSATSKPTFLTKNSFFFYITLGMNVKAICLFMCRLHGWTR